MPPTVDGLLYQLYAGTPKGLGSPIVNHSTGWTPYFQSTAEIASGTASDLSNITAITAGFNLFTINGGPYPIFSAQLSGFFFAALDGDYGFSVAADDYALVWVFVNLIFKNE